ncbi:MOSC and FAD-binding oxidoreductase domain-containing protein [Fodinicola acaciae]|uniref:MOSC and FAD-binding oxidoreductase domain-containing protein n=1 Tax=Fodinicola acaciae TaxID=2681555 RepID=UPI0013D71C45|nr:MOSC and FAD-binding oxidoreductase domain-containing protein [Fodinicola acaciae]
MATLVSVNVGQPRDIAWNGVTVHTGAWKDPVEGARTVRRHGMDGDGQGDLAGHGGPNRAVLVYQTQAYEHWKEFFRRDDLKPGYFAENLTVDGLADTEVRIGDRYRIGDAEFEVSQPRVTCFRAGLRIGEPRLASLLVSHHRPGFYLRVVKEGQVRAGDDIVRTATGKVSVADLDALLYLPDPDLATVRAMIDDPALSEGWRGSLRDILADTPKKPTTWPGFRPLRVTEVRRESERISSFTLADPDGEELPAALPGQYLTVRLRTGAVRSYSLSATDRYRISVKREPAGSVSGLLHETLRPGAIADVAAPRGDFVLDDDDTRPVVLVSAGIGITPVLAMLHRLAAGQSTREVWWLHAARRPAEQVFAGEVGELLAELPASHAKTFYSADSDRLTAGAIARMGLPTDAVAYVCGPAGFMDDMTGGLRAAGVTDVRTEIFGALSAINPGVVEHDRPAPHQPAGPPGTGPAITFARSGITAAFDQTKPNLLAFAESCDIPTRWQCRTGVCQTCVTPLLSGEVDYQPAPLLPPAEGTVLVCCARPRTDTVLDL